jgi:hypothetical protein
MDGAPLSPCRSKRLTMTGTGTFPYKYITFTNDSWDAVRNPWKVYAPELFFYARDNYGNMNSWDVEISVRGPTGEWDNFERPGQNYRFKL